MESDAAHLEAPTPPEPRKVPKPLSKSAEEPLYRQLYRRLRNRIEAGEFGVGGAIPPESSLMRAYGVSRITVRSALDQLVRDGLIERQRGRGSFVRSERPETRSCLSSFTDQMLALGRTPSAEVVRLETLPERERRGLELPFDDDAEVLLIERLRSVDGERAGLVRTYLLRELVPDLTEDAFSTTGRGQSLLHVLEHVCGVVLDRGEETTLPVALPAPVARLLGCAEGTAAILEMCVLADVSGREILYEEAYWGVARKQLVQRYPDRA